MKELTQEPIAAPRAEVDKLRLREKAHTHEGDAIAAARRRLPMVEVNPATPLVGERGVVTLLDAFEGRRQLIAYYFMWYTGKPAPEQCEGAPGLHHKCGSCPMFILVMSHSRCFARGRTTRAPDTGTSWDGKYLGTRRRTRSTRCWLLPKGLAGCTWCAICDRVPKSSKRIGRRFVALRLWITTIDYST